MNLHQLIIILWSRKGTAFLALAVTVITTLAISLSLPKEYVSTATLAIDQVHVDPVTGSRLPSQLMTGYMATQVDVIGSHNVAKRVVKKLKLIDDKKMLDEYVSSGSQSNTDDWIADFILENIDVKPSRESSLIDISYTSSDSQFAANCANAFAEAYIQANIELRAQPAKQSAIWFENQKEILRERLEYAQSVLSNYQLEHGIISLDDSLNLENTKLIDLSHQLVNSQANTRKLQSRVDQLAIIVEQGGSYQSLQEVLSNPLVQSLKSDLARAESKFAELAKRIDKNHPQYKQARAEIYHLKRKISSEVKILIGSISSQADASNQRDKILALALAEQKIKVLELKKQHDGIIVLSREAESAQLAYDGVMQKSIQTLMESEVSQSNIAILNPAIPAHKHSKPRVLLNLILSVFLGALLGLGAALIIELIDRRVRSSDDVSSALSIPVFAVISGKKY